MEQDIYKEEFYKYLKSSKTPSEDVLEKALIHFLIKENNYKYRPDITDSSQLKQNFRNHFERLNDIKIEDSEFEKWWIDFNSGDIIKRFQTLKSDPYQYKDKNNKVIKTCKYFDFDNIENNEFEIINQLWTRTKDKDYRRFDVLLLINGIPIVHIELKKESNELDDAVRQINEYINIEAISDFLRFTKLYIISNGTETRYFTNNNAIHKTHDNLPLIWTDFKNNNIDGEQGILKFAKQFLDKSFLLNFIDNYFVIDTKKQRINVFRPYQYYACNSIIERINNPNLSNKEKSGYVWHATGSGKTLTSFMTSQILSKKCKAVDLTIFLIDRNDLNTQTYDNFCSFADDPKFIKNATDTNNLIELLTDPKSNKWIIITTIQKLNNALRETNKDKISSLSNKNVVFMVDECHRSQVGEMRRNIDKFFKNSINIAFTGTPIFDTNSVDGKTTENIFGKEIHQYTSYHAIKDKNVLDWVFEWAKWRNIDTYTSTTKQHEDDLHEKLENIQYKSIDFTKILEITNYISMNYNNLTRERKFNAMLACSSIQEAIEYYKELQNNKNLSCAIIYSLNNNDYSKNMNLNQEASNFLLERIKEYNSSWDLSCFNKYKTAIQNDFRNRKYDLIIVVSMLLTGYDSPVTNTLFLDKRLEYHSLIQAISRTNRLSPGKETGIIISFQTTREELDEALRLYTNGDVSTPSLLKISTYNEVKKEFEEVIDALLKEFPSIDDVVAFNDSDAELTIKFLNLFKQVMKIFNKIKPLIDFNWNDFKMNERTFNKYKLSYKKLFSKAKEIKIIPEWSGNQIVDFDEIIVDVKYLKSLIYQIKKHKEEDVPDVIDENFDLYKKISQIIREKSNDTQNNEVLLEFLRNRRIYTSGNYDEIISLWKEYIQSKISDATNEAIEDWKTTSEVIQAILKEFKIKQSLDNDFLTKKLPEFINDPLFDDKKFETVNYFIKKIAKLNELKSVGF